jgi:hypothetical protein
MGEVSDGVAGLLVHELRTRPDKKEVAIKNLELIVIIVNSP